MATTNWANPTPAPVAPVQDPNKPKVPGVPVPGAPVAGAMAPAPIAAAPIAAPAANTSTSTYTSGSPLVVPTATSQAPGGGTIQTSFRNALVGQLQQDPNKVSLTDPTLAPQVRANQDAETRSLADQQRELAEQAFAGGTRNTGAYGADLQQLRQQQGERMGQFNAGLIGQEQQRRTQALLQSLGIGGNFLTAQSAQAIQSMLGKGQLSLGMLQTLLQDRQANNRLGLDAGIASQGFNQDALIKALGLG